MTNRPDTKISRRRILQASALTAPLVLPARLLRGAGAPSNRITLGFIGLGVHGLGVNLKTLLHQDDAQVVAVCDTFASRAKEAKSLVDQKNGNGDCRTYGDFRELLAARDIQAVVISTPDHWHVPMSMMALDAGKDIMCEKPTLTIAQGRELVQKLARTKAVYAIGLEDRSVIQYHKLAEMVRNGGIGTLKTIRISLPAGKIYPKEAPAPVPADLNYKLWSGPAPFHPYTPSRTEPQAWRQVRDYSGGKFADWGSHLIDTAQVANFCEESGPVEVEGTGQIPPDAINTMPATYKLRYRYANGVEMLIESGDIALRFEGTEGWVGNKGWRGRLEGSDEALLRKKFPAETTKIWPMPPHEHRNFLDCIKSRKAPTYTAEGGHRLSTVMHIGNIAIELGRKLRWDPAAEAFVNDDAANKLRSRPTHDDWAKA